MGPSTPARIDAQYYTAAIRLELRTILARSRTKLMRADARGAEQSVA
jgi:hypothetical protein